MASTSFADFEQHYLALFNWVDQGTLKHLQACKNFVNQRVPCKIDDGPGSQDMASTMLLGRSWNHWHLERRDRTLELLRLYERAGYVDGARLLGPVGIKNAEREFERPIRRLPLVSAVHFHNTAATVLLLDCGMLKVTDVRPPLEAILREYEADKLHLLTPEVTNEAALTHFAELHWADDPAGMAMVREALMRHHLRERGAAPSAKGDASARRQARANI